MATAVQPSRQPRSSDDVRGRSDAPRGRTPVIGLNHKRAGLGLISAVSNKGERRWMMLNGAIKAAILISFLARLVRAAGRKVFLILDRLPGWDNLLIAAGCGGRALELAPAAGRVIADLVTAVPTDGLDLASFRLERFAAAAPA